MNYIDVASNHVIVDNVQRHIKTQNFLKVFVCQTSAKLLASHLTRFVNKTSVSKITRKLILWQFTVQLLEPKGLGGVVSPNPIKFRSPKSGVGDPVERKTALRPLA